MLTELCLHRLYARWEGVTVYLSPSACNGTIAPASNVVTRITDSPQPGALAFTEKAKEKKKGFF